MKNNEEELSIKEWEKQKAEWEKERNEKLAEERLG